MTVPFQPMRLLLASGAVLLVDRPEQVPTGIAFEPVMVNATAPCSDTELKLEQELDEDNRAIYQEISPQDMADAIVKGLAVELDAAALALATAASWLKDGSCTPYKASQIHQASQRARAAWRSIVNGDDQ